MAAQNGRSFLIKTQDVGSPTNDYETIGGFRTKSLRINNSVVDITDQDSAGFREILAGAGVGSLTVTGSGVFKDAVSEGLLETRALPPNDAANYQIVVPGLGTFQGSFVVTDLSYEGPHDDAVTFSVTLESAGAITFTSS